MAGPSQATPPLQKSKMFLVTFMVLLQTAHCTSSGDGHLDMEEVRTLLDHYSSEMEAGERHGEILREFSSYLSRLVQSSAGLADVHSDVLTSAVIMAVFRLRGNIIKNRLSMGVALRVDPKHLGPNVALWSADLLLELLKVQRSNPEVGVARDEGGRASLDLAVKLGMTDIVELLVEYGYKICFSLDPPQCTDALSHATINQDMPTMTYLIEWLSPKLASHHLCKLLSDTRKSHGKSPLDIAHFQCNSGLNCDMFEYLSQLVGSCSDGHHPISPHPYPYTTLMCPGKHTPTFPSKGLERWWRCVEGERGCSTSDAGQWSIYEEHHVGRRDCDLLRISALDMTPEEFEKDFVNLSVPVVLTDMTEKWQVLREWRRDTMAEHWPHMDMLVGPIPYGEVFGERFGYATVEEFLAYMDGYAAQLLTLDNTDVESFKAPLYVFDSELLQSHFEGMYSFKGLNLSVWRDVPRYPQFILGPPGSGAPHHFHCHALNALLFGRKKWFLYPPGAAFYSKQHPLLWYKSEYRHLQHTPVECVQRPGDVVYVPAMWTHSTINLDECVGLALELDTGDC